MDKIPIELCKEIHSFLYPIRDVGKLKYQKSVIWCKRCGEKLTGDDWFLYMNDHTVIVSYKCEFCSNENIIGEDEDWSTLITYATRTN